MRSLLTLFFLAHLAWAAPVPKNRKQQADDQYALAGHWQQTYPESKSIWKFDEEGNGLIDHGGGFLVKVKFALYPDKQPKEIDWTLTDGNNRFHGIYFLEGDKLIFNLNGINAPRAKAIGRMNGSVCYEFERIKE